MRSPSPIIDSIVPPAELPDYITPRVLTDADNHLWLVPAPTPFGVVAPSPRVCDIFDRNGTLVDRVQLPIGEEIAGFAPGIVYVTSSQGTGQVLMRVRMR